MLHCYVATYVYFNIIVQFQVSIVGTNTRETVTGMNSSTTYECTIYAVTVLDGPASNPVTVITDPGMYEYICIMHMQTCMCKYKYLCICTVHNVYIYTYACYTSYFITFLILFCVHYFSITKCGT